MNLDKFLQDGQDAKVAEKIHYKIMDMLTAGEFIQYISIQKKPAVTLLPDSITVSNKRIFLCEFTKLGFATNFEIFSWGDIKDIAFKEELFGSKVTVIPFTGENLTIDYIPKVQARKLYQLIKSALEHPQASESGRSGPAIEDKKPIEGVAKPTPSSALKPDTPEKTTASVAQQNRADLPSAAPVTAPQPIATEIDDELTQKLKKLKTLYDRQLITQAEYENKKSELLSQL